MFSIIPSKLSTAQECCVMSFTGNDSTRCISQINIGAVSYTHLTLPTSDLV